MKQMIKFEVKRMLRNPGFYIAMRDRFKFCVNVKN